MVTKKIKRTITVESWQRTVIRQNSRKPIWCEFCASAVLMLTPDQAATTFNIDLGEIHRRIKNGLIHFTENGGSLLICLNSLSSNQKMH